MTSRVATFVVPPPFSVGTAFSPLFSIVIDVCLPFSLRCFPLEVGVFGKSLISFGLNTSNAVTSFRSTKLVTASLVLKISSHLKLKLYLNWRVLIGPSLLPFSSEVSG